MEYLSNQYAVQCTPLTHSLNHALLDLTCGHPGGSFDNGRGGGDARREAMQQHHPECRCGHGEEAEAHLRRRAKAEAVGRSGKW